ncbi:hypothetical protein AA103196_0714 [Ameyamaea chiangmaiensis NBRC 103196]|uniref:Uncharacterized protein n=1 Tax=Ameyamaea chiangmaiensis TaxID=442969 RepID=A0A850P8K5_9PROT|nr:hypothetical protein [Ameyamaea chiangmaiensis]MBS4075816.1 hypothetical protein [Ameyamaea chiangmaiensis]NVN39313.1 hypothetical protein [Ameyamaea chiangmaiensis]GBQ63850.1 hypothetical protein AA103196_0714 [Ameyamaea chiangmaiensis NBRC 103196]
MTDETAAVSAGDASEVDALRARLADVVSELESTRVRLLQGEQAQREERRRARIHLCAIKFGALDALDLEKLVEFEETELQVDIPDDILDERIERLRQSKPYLFDIGRARGGGIMDTVSGLAPQPMGGCDEDVRRIPTSDYEKAKKSFLRI